MRWGRWLCAALLVLTMLPSCENKFREQRAPASRSGPQPDRGPCARVPPPVLFVRLPRFLRKDTSNKRYCEPLDKLLRDRGLGSAHGDAPSPRDGSGFSGCAVFSGDVDAALELMGPKLKQLGAPKGTVIEELCTGVGSVHLLH